MRGLGFRASGTGILKESREAVIGICFFGLGVRVIARLQGDRSMAALFVCARNTNVIMV